jgi:site-specific recombinase XerC
MSVTENDYLFSHGPKGKRYSTTGLFLSFRKAVAKSGLPKHLGHPHACRHTYCTVLLRDTGNLRFVQKMAGHQAITMTSLYADILPEQNGELASKLTL